MRRPPFPPASQTSELRNEKSSGNDNDIFPLPLSFPYARGTDRRTPSLRSDSSLRIRKSLNRAIHGFVYSAEGESWSETERRGDGIAKSEAAVRSSHTGGRTAGSSDEPISYFTGPSFLLG